QTDDYMIRVMHVKNANGESKTLQFPLRLDLDRPKRARTTFSVDQLAALDYAYRRNGYVTGEKRAKLAETLGLTDTQVKVWFQNRRTKDRKKKESDDEEPTKKQRNGDSSPSPSSSSSSSNSFPVPPIISAPPNPTGVSLPRPPFLPPGLLSIPNFSSSSSPLGMPLFPFPYPPGFI
ncbi:hypothetical protein PFISCL1PPCAC_14430, partial [Pristionchus fissidentatus]